jgi:cation diffusion facilitator family transporter
MSSNRGSDEPRSRYSEVSGVLVRVLVLNLAVALAKVAFGYLSGAISILSDGFHSLTDAASNVVGLVGIYAARRPPDDDHPYGHRKYETVAAAAIAAGLLLVVLEVLRNAFNHLSGRSAAPVVSALGFVIMVATLAINLGVVRYETRQAKRLSSELLLADALQTRGDVWTSAAVLVALAAVRAGYPILDPIAALIVAGFIGHAGFQIATTTTHILSDRTVMSERDIEEVVVGVPGVLGCHHIRTRGAADHVFLDLHVWLPGDMPLNEAHSISHVVKDRLMAQHPQIVDAVIHIEPPPAA